MRHLIIATTLLTLTVPASAAPRQLNYCASHDETTCGTITGCSWKASETWTREGDNKTRTTKARCAYDAKAAKAALAAMAK